MTRKGVGLGEGAIQLGYELRSVAAGAGRQNPVHSLQLLDVTLDSIERERVQGLAEKKGGAGEGALVLCGSAGGSGGPHGARIDDHQGIGAELARGRERNVLAKRTVAVELAVDPHGREEERDCR